MIGRMKNHKNPIVAVAKQADIDDSLFCGAIDHSDAFAPPTIRLPILRSEEFLIPVLFIQATPWSKAATPKVQLEIIFSGGGYRSYPHAKAGAKAVAAAR